MVFWEMGGLRVPCVPTVIQKAIIAAASWRGYVLLERVAMERETMRRRMLLVGARVWYGL